jgi:hypothetical protein
MMSGVLIKEDILAGTIPPFLLFSLSEIQM